MQIESTHQSGARAISERPQFPTCVKRILVGLDFTELSEHALDYALVLAKQLDASVVVCHVVPPAPAPVDAAVGLVMLQPDLVSQTKAAEEATRSVIEHHAKLGVSVLTVLREGDPATEIAAAARETAADLVVVGTRGRSGISRLLLGDVADLLTRLTNIPVLMLH